MRPQALGQIIIVDDEVELMMALQEILTDQGYQVSGYTDGPAALAALREQEFDIIITDLMMPGMNGMALLREAAQLAPYMVGIMMTGQGTIQSAIDAMKIGAYDYVLKPFTLANLLPVIDRAMEVHRLRMENVQLRETIAIYELSTAIAFSMDINTLLNKTVQAARQQVDADEVSIMLPTSDNNLYVAAVAGENREHILGQRERFNQGIAGWVAEHRQALTLEGKSVDPRIVPLFPRDDVGFSISLPMLSGGALVGVLNVSRKPDRHPMTLGQAKALGILVSIASSALESARLFSEIRREEEKYRVTLASIGDAVITTDSGGRVAFMNPIAEALLGCREKEAMGQPLEQVIRIVNEKTQGPVENPVAKVLREGTTVGLANHTAILLADGRMIPIEDSAAPIRGASGETRGVVLVFHDITDRRKAEQILRESEARLARYRLLFEQARDICLFVRFSDGRILEANRAAEQAYGYTREELLQLNIADLRSPESREPLRAQMAAANQEGILFETIHQRKDGTVFPVEVSAMGANYSGERLNLGVIRNITERKQAEATIREREQDLHSILEHSGDGIALTDEQQQIVEWNRALEVLTGLSKEDVAGQPVTNILYRFRAEGRRTPQKAAQLKQSFEAINHGQTPPWDGKWMDTEITHPDGERRLAQAKGFTLTSRGGIKLGAILRDVTQQAQAESALRESEQKYRAIVEQNSEGIVLLDERGTIIEWNRAQEQITGIPRQESLGKPFWEVQYRMTPTGKREHEELEPCKRKTIEDYLEIIRDRSGQSIEIEIQKPDGAMVGVQQTIFPIQTDHGMLIGSITHDITRRKQAEQALRENEAKFRSYIEQSPVAIFVADRSGIYQESNPAASEMLGYDPQTLTQMHILDITPEEDREVNQKDFARLFEQGSLAGEYRLKKRDDSPVWVNLRAVALNQQTGIAFCQDISDRKAAERVLEERLALQDQLAKIATSVPGMIMSFRLRPDGTTCMPYATKALQDLYGLQPEDVLLDASPVLSRIYPEDMVHIGKTIEESARNLTPFRDEWRVNHPERGEIWVEGNSMPLREPDGSTLWHGYVQDITERKRAEQALRESEQRLAMHLQKTPLAVIEYDAHHYIRTWNPAAERIFGYRAEEVIGKHTTLLIPEEERKQVSSVIRKLEKRQGGERNTNRNITKDGRLIDCEWYNTPLVDETGALIGIASLVQDITDRVQAQKELLQYKDHLEELVQQRTAKLAESEAILRKNAAEISDLYNRAPCGYHSINGERTIVRINDTELEWLGYSREEIVGKKKITDLLTPAEQERFKTGQADFARTGVAQNVESVMVRKDGSYLPVLLNASAQFDEQGNFLETRATLVDNTHLLNTRMALNEAKEAAEAANRAKSAFLANMSHEIRTPMNAILGFTQLLLRDPRLLADQKLHLETINRSGEHLLKLINDVLEMSKIEADRVTLNPTTFDLPALVADLETMFRVRTDAKNLSLEVELSPSLPRVVKADEGKLRQILINLVGNAVKFTQAGGIRWRMWATPIPGNRLQLVAEVQDTGPGISPGEMGVLFSPFGQTRSGTDAGGGTGLGLAISSRYAQMMGGKLTAASDLSRGSTFRMEVEIQEGKVEEALTSLQTRRVIGLKPGQKAFQILVVDDHEENRQAISELLRSVGFVTHEATDGEAAIHAVTDLKPDLVLMDIRMPGIDGLEATQRLKSSEASRQIPIIAVTANAFADDRDAALRAGANGYIRKPFKENELFDAIAQVARIEYEYESVPGAASPAQSADQPPFSPEDAVILPPALATQIRQATLTANLNQLLILIAQVEEVSPAFARYLQYLANTFRYDDLLKLFPSE